LALGLLVFGYLWRLQRLRRERELRYSRELEQNGPGAHACELEERNQQLQVLSRAKEATSWPMSSMTAYADERLRCMTSLLLDTASIRRSGVSPKPFTGPQIRCWRSSTTSDFSRSRRVACSSIP